MKNIQYLIDENKQLKEAFAYELKITVRRSLTGNGISFCGDKTYLSKEEFQKSITSDNIKQSEVILKMEKDYYIMKRQLSDISKLVRNKIILRLSKIVKILDN